MPRWLKALVSVGALGALAWWIDLPRVTEALVSADLAAVLGAALVFGAGPVATVMANPKFIAMQADWTRPDPAIAAYLAGFGRYGIPFNAIYGPRSPAGMALPELLSENTVISALEQASGDRTIANSMK